MEISERKIRDYLAKNLDTFFDGYQLIDTEYKLDNIHGCKGFVDILAKDKFDNLVIIEIKRSRQASRQALQEVLKYAGLLKQEMSVRNSDIRICIVSTDWGELLVPFSELNKHVDYLMEGIKLYLDDSFIPCRIERVKPIEKKSARFISPVQMVFIYDSEDGLAYYQKIIEDRAHNVGISDFVILRMEFTRENHPAYPLFALYFSMQEYTKDELEKLAVEYYELNDVKEVIEYVMYNESDREFSIIHSLTENALSWITMVNTGQTDLEAATPETLNSMLVSEGWEISNITRSGFFSKDPRRDELLISEIKGNRGEFDTKYKNHCSSDHKSRLIEIKNLLPQYLSKDYGSNAWLKQAIYSFGFIVSSKNKYELNVDIFNPRKTILETLFHIAIASTLGGSHPFQFKPYYLFVSEEENLEGTKSIFMGDIVWDGRSNNFHHLVNEILDGDLQGFIERSHIGFTDYLEDEIMSFLGLSYVTKFLINQNGSIYNVATFSLDLDGEVSEEINSKLLCFEDFVTKNKNFIDDLVAGYSRHITYVM